MRSVSIDQLRIGDRLGRDVHAVPGSLPLLRAGVRMSGSFQDSLRRAGVTSVWIDDGLSQGIEPLEVLEEATKHRATAAIKEAFRDVTRSLNRGAAVSFETAQEMRDVADQIVEDLSRNLQSALALNDLANADGYTLKHSLAVTTLGLSLGLRVLRKQGWVDARGVRRYDKITERLSALGVGLLLHDIGKLGVPPDILSKPGPLTPEEWQVMRSHPTLGYDMLKNEEAISPLARTVVRSHHERWNGGGYPDGHSGEEIHPFARIAAVADVFDAVTSDRCYRRGTPMHEAWAMVTGGANGDFDPDVVEAFRAIVTPYPPGSPIVLSDGCRGIVKTVKAGAVETPVVRIVMDPSGAMIAPREIDLSRQPALRIVSTEFDIPQCDPV